MARLMLASVMFALIGFYAGYSYLYSKYREAVIDSEISKTKELIVLGGAYLQDANLGVHLESALLNTKETLNILKTSDELSEESEEEVASVEPLLVDVLSKLKEHNQRTQFAPSGLGPR